MKKLVCLFLVLCAAVVSGNMAPEVIEDGVRYWWPDFTEDWWEAMYPTACDTRLWDSSSDPDGDGWDNWSEARYSAKMKQAIRPDKSDSYPIPDIKFIIKNTSAVVEGKVVVMSYSTAAMNSSPVATFTFDLGNTRNFEYQTKTPVQGNLVQGNMWFFAFIDTNSNQKWDVGEPAGLASEFPYQVGWDKNTVTFVLAVNPVNGFVRVAWPEDPTVAGYYVSLQRVTYTGEGTNVFPVYTTVYSKSISGRNWLHEGDILDTSAYHVQAPHGYGPGPGLDWGGIIDGPTPMPIGYVSTYRLVVNTKVIDPLIKIYYVPQGEVLATPTLISPPTQSSLLSPDLRFQFVASFSASAFELQIVPAGSTTPVYSTGGKALPLAIDAKGTREVYLPVKLGDVIPGGSLTDTEYKWRVRVFQPRDPNVTQSSYTPYSKFYTYLNHDDAWFNEFGNVSYRGKGLTATCSFPTDWVPDSRTVRHQVFTTASFNGIPIAQKTTVATNTLTSTTFYGLREGIPYYIRSYVDSNRSNRYAAWKTSGYYTITNAANKWLWQPAPVYATYPPKTYEVELHFSDTNADGISDESGYINGGFTPVQE